MTKKPLHRIPKYRLHKASGRAVVTLPVQGLPRGRDVFLGKFGTPESKQKYAQVIAQWTAHGDVLPKASSDLTIVELVDRYWQYVRNYYLKDGKPTAEQVTIKQALKPLIELYGVTPAKEFGPVAMKMVRQAMIDKDWCRKNINQQISRVKRFFAWCVENELIPGEVHHSLSAVQGLRMGRCGARESEPVRPVPDHLVDGIREHVSPAVWAMIELQRLTGMRPGEVTIMCGADLETSGKVWLYRPASHKTQHHGHERVVHIGPKAQAILRPWLKTNLQAFLFNPREEAEASLQNGNRSRRGLTVQDRQRPPGDHYTTASYRRAIERGCDLAFPPVDSELQSKLIATEERDSLGNPVMRRETKAEVDERVTDDQRSAISRWKAEHRWHPHQLRHNAATGLRKQYGIEAARVILGHRSAAITELYAEIDHAKAHAIIAEVG